MSTYDKHGIAVDKFFLFFFKLGDFPLFLDSNLQNFYLFFLVLFNPKHKRTSVTAWEKLTYMAAKNIEANHHDNDHHGHQVFGWHYRCSGNTKN